MEAAGKRYIIYPSRSNILTIWNFSDIHYGSKGCSKKQLEADINTVKNDPNSYFILGGDQIDAISPSDKRWSAATMDPEVTVHDLGKLGMVLIRRIRDWFYPIRHKCIGALLGNHEATYQGKMEQELHGWLCAELEIQNLMYSSLVDLVFCRWTGHRPGMQMHIPTPPGKGNHGVNDIYALRMFCHHGAGGANTPGGKTNRMIQFTNSCEADIYMIGHSHDMKAEKVTITAADGSCTKIIQKQRLVVMAGSYLKTNESGCVTYGERAGYRPTTLGASKITVYPNKRHFESAI